MTSPALRLDLLDHSISPAQDLYRHVNGGWLATATIPDDKNVVGAFVTLRDDSEQALHDICDTLAATATDTTTEEGKVAALYGSFLDEDRAEELGASPLTPLLARIAAIATVDDLRAWMGWCLRQGLSTLVGADVDSDPGDPSRYRLFVGQDGLGLPDEAYYHADEHADIREQYKTHLAATLALTAGREEPSDQDAADAAAVFELETAIAAHHWDVVKTRDMLAMYNPQTRAELSAAAPDFGWDTLFTAAGVDAQVTDVINCQPPFFPGVAALLDDAHLPAWRAWARYHLVSDLSPYLSADFVDGNFHFYGTVLGGQPTNKARWKRAVAFTESAMGEALGKIYVETHFPAEAATRMDALVANLLAAYRTSIESLDWMTDATRAEALKKLDGFRPKIGYPKRWRDYSALTVGNDLVPNVLAVGEFETAYDIGKLAGPIDPDEWEMYPQTVNAYYHPLRNEIVFPAAILQPPFFNVDADDAVNYGGIGAVIGHEIGHGFDDQGSTCDGEGRLRDWWTAEDHVAFEERTHALIAQYDALVPAQLPGRHVNGALTIGENIGDLGGLGIAIMAWRLAGGDGASPIDGYTGLQRLFMSWATGWQTLMRPERLALLLATDPHSPDEFRCNQIVSNLDDFYAAFEVEPGDPMYLAPEDRVTIW